MAGGRAVEEEDILEGLSILHLKASGLWQAMNHFRLTGRKSLSLKAIAAFILLMNPISIACQVWYIFLVNFEVEKMSMTLVCVSPVFVVLCKVNFFWFSLGELSAIFEDSLRRDFLKSIPADKLKDTRKIYERATAKCNWCFLLTISEAATGIITWAVMPGYPTDDPSSGRRKMLSNWYPFRYSESPRYEMVVGSEVVNSMVCGLVYGFYQLAIVTPLFCLCGHFEALSHHIATISEQGGAADMNRDLGLILQDYGRLLRLGEHIKSVYNSFITVWLGVAIFNVVVTVLYVIFATKSLSAIIRLLSISSLQLTELILICYCSSAIESASSGIRQALYTNDWYLADKKFAMAQQMMMIRASRPLTLTAVNMYPVNMETLLGIFQFIYSTTTILSKAN